MKMLVLAAAVAAVVTTVVTTGATPGAMLVAPEPVTIAGLWDAVVVANEVEVPFRFEIASTGAEVEGFFFEGDRKVGSTSGRYADGVLTLEYDHLNTTLQAT